MCSSARIARLHGKKLEASCRRAGLRADWLFVPDGERAKTMEVVSGLLRRMCRRGAGRDSAMVAFGGGTVGDAAGFAAGIYMRGISVVQVPTTLEAQVDAAIGGKTAADLPEGKNLAGVFHQPSLVVSDTRVLETLPKRQIRSGLAEVVKHGVIARPGFFAWLERNAGRLAAGDPAALNRAVVESSRVKARVVSGDERESGRRIILNLGHTLAHAIEAASGFRGVMHGEAVSVGMVCAARLSAEMGICPSSVPERIEELLRRIGLPVRVPPGLSRSRMREAMGHDKKNRLGRIRLVLTRKIGGVTVVDNVTRDRVLRTADGMIGGRAGAE